MHYRAPYTTTTELRHNRKAINGALNHPVDTQPKNLEHFHQPICTAQIGNRAELPGQARNTDRAILSGSIYCSTIAHHALQHVGRLEERGVGTAAGEVGGVVPLHNGPALPRGVHFPHAAVSDQPALVVAHACMVHEAEEAPMRDYEDQLACTEWMRSLWGPRCMQV